jgi:hypothetical protein
MPDQCPCETADIESRQDEVLRQLDELNRRLEQVLAEYGASPRPQTDSLPKAA